MDFVQRVIDINTPCLVIPSVLGREAHTVQQEAIQQFSIGGQPFEPFPGYKLAGDTVIGKLVALFTIVIIKFRSCGHNQRPPFGDEKSAVLYGQRFFSVFCFVENALSYLVTADKVSICKGFKMVPYEY